jgi:hypothetical protein
MFTAQEKACLTLKETQNHHLNANALQKDVIVVGVSCSLKTNLKHGNSVNQ